MNKLPKVFANPINKKINNEQTNYRSYKDYSNRDGISNLDVDRILNSNKHIFRSKVRILLNDNYFKKTIISRNGDYIITIDNEKIPIKNIKSIDLI